MRLVRILLSTLLLTACASQNTTELSASQYSAFERGIRLDTKRYITAELNRINNPQLTRSFTFDGTEINFDPSRLRRGQGLPTSVDEFDRFARTVQKAFDEEERRRRMCMVAICHDRGAMNFARSSKSDGDDQDTDVEKSRKRYDAAEKAAREEKIAKKVADSVRQAEEQRHEACKRYGYGC